MKHYSQRSGEINDSQGLPIWKKVDGVDLAYVGYGLVIVTLVVVSYILGAFHLLPRDPQDIDLGLMIAPPGTAGHLLGTDFMGRDMLSRIIVGIQAYFLPGLLAIFIALFLGTLIGVLAGYWGGKFDTGITYFTNLIDSFPRLVLILLVIAAFKPDIYYIMVVVGLTNVPVVTSLIKGKIQFLKQKNFIEADVALGVPTRTITLETYPLAQLQIAPHHSSNTRHGRGHPDGDFTQLPRFRCPGANPVMGQHGAVRRELLHAGEVLAIHCTGTRDPVNDPRFPSPRRRPEQHPGR